MIVALLAFLAQPAQSTPPPDGARLFRRCIACHALEPGANSPAGPTLHAIVGRAVAAEPNFRYSPALRTYAREYPRWSEVELDRFLADPWSVVPGTHMSFQGIGDPTERHTLIRWLNRPAARGD